MKYTRRGALTTGAPSGSVEYSSEKSYADSVKNIFYAWQPSTWPEAPEEFDKNFGVILERILRESMINEIDNIFNDIKKSSSEGLEHRGHVVAVVLLSAIDAVSSYAYNKPSEKCLACKRGDSVGPRYSKFIENHFPENYKRYSSDIYKVYRNSLVHSWNLFEATMFPGDQPISSKDGIVSFGLLNFYAAFKYSINDFFNKLKEDRELQRAALERYRQLRSTAR